jgi:L-cysteine desulfidase
MASSQKGGNRALMILSDRQDGCKHMVFAKHELTRGYINVYDYCKHLLQGRSLMSSATKDKKQQPLVRIDSADKEVLDQLSAKTGESTPRLLHRAVKQLKKDIFFELMHGAYRNMRSDAVAWESEQRERSLLNNAIGDGLGA